MNLPALMVYLAAICLLGHALVSALYPSRRLGLLEWTSLAPPLGAGSMGVLLFWFSLAGMPPSRPILCVISVLALGTLMMLEKAGRSVAVGLPGESRLGSPWMLFPLLVLVVAAGVIAVATWFTPVSDLDAFSIWIYKAKFLTHHPLHPAPAWFHDASLSYSHPDYPLLVPFLTAGGYAAAGGMDDHTAKAMSLFLDFLILPMVYHGLRWRLPRLPAALLTTFLGGLPAFFVYAGQACADLPLALFYGGSTLHLLKWFEERRGPDLATAALFTGFAAFTKNEGMALASVNVLLVLAITVFGKAWTTGTSTCSPGWKAALGFLCLSAALILPSWFWSRSIPSTHENYRSRLFSAAIVENLPRLKTIFPAFWSQAVTFDSWGLLWLLLIGIAALGWRALLRPVVQVLWLLLGLHLLLYVWAYLVTPWNLDTLFFSTITRLLLHTIPVVMWLIGWHWAESAAEAGVALKTISVTAAGGQQP